METTGQLITGMTLPNMVSSGDSYIPVVIRTGPEPWPSPKLGSGECPVPVVVFIPGLDLGIPVWYR